MPADWGAAPWRIDLAIPSGPVPDQVDAVVVGAGFTGLSAAYHLARAGVRTAVLEADTIGAGASGRTGGLALEGTAAGPLPDADDCLASLARITREAAIDCDLRLDGCWEVVHQHARGLRPPLWRDGDAFLCVAGTEPGGTVDAGALVAGLARATLRHGATIHEHSPATRVVAGEVHCGTRSLRAGHIVLALNAYTTTLLSLPIQVSASLTLAVCTAPVGDDALAALGMAARIPFYTGDVPYLWGRTLADNRLVFGAGLIYPADGDVRAVSITAPETAAALARLEARVHGLHPVLARILITHRWGGPIAFRSGPPILTRHPDHPDTILAGAYAGHGVALSVHVGRLIADAITHGRSLPSWGILRGDAPTPGRG